MNLAARRLDLLDQRLELVAVAASGEDREAFRGEFLGDLAADEVAGADHGDGRVSLLQGSSPGRWDTARLKY